MRNKTTWLLSLSLSLSLGLSFASSVFADGSAKVTPLMSKDLVSGPNKEITMITVEYQPGGTDPIHTHDAQAFVYVIEGSIVMQVKGGPQVTLSPGETFYEGPDDVHIVGRNASKTKPAKFVVLLIKEKGAPILTPTQQ
jgi:quercetin dioxygenase-like cupin family protein